MSGRIGIFAGDNPFHLCRLWLKEAEVSELADANAIALSSVDEDGLPNVRIVLLKHIEEDAFVFYTNYESKKGHGDYSERQGRLCALLEIALSPDPCQRARRKRRRRYGR